MGSKSSIPDPAIGLVISYDYLWINESEKGQETASKSRPAVIIMSVEQGNKVRVLPISTKEPSSKSGHIQIPSDTIRRLKLGHDPSYIILTELNEFEWPGPDLSKTPNGQFYYGYLSEGMIKQLKTHFRAVVEQERVKRTVRTE